MNIAQILSGSQAVDTGQKTDNSQIENGFGGDSFIDILASKLGTGDFSLQLNDLVSEHVEIPEKNSYLNENGHQYTDSRGDDDSGQSNLFAIAAGDNDHQQLAAKFEHLIEEKGINKAEDFEKLGFDTDTARQLEELAEDFDPADVEDLARLKELLEENEEKSESTDAQKLIELLAGLLQELEKFKELLEEGDEKELLDRLEDLGEVFEIIKEELTDLDDRALEALLEEVEIKLEEAGIDFDIEQLKKLLVAEDGEGLVDSAAEIIDSLAELEELIKNDTGSEEAILEKLQEVKGQITDFQEALAETDSSKTADSGEKQNDSAELVERLLNEKLSALLEKSEQAGEDSEEVSKEVCEIVEEAVEEVKENIAEKDTENTTKKDTQKVAEKVPDKATEKEVKEFEHLSEKDKKSDAKVEEVEDRTVGEKDDSEQVSEKSDSKSENSSKSSGPAAREVEEKSAEKQARAARASRSKSASKEPKTENKSAAQAETADKIDPEAAEGKADLNSLFAERNIEASGAKFSENSSNVSETADKVPETADKKPAETEAQKQFNARPRQLREMAGYEINSAGSSSADADSGGENFMGHGKSFSDQPGGEMLENEQVQASYLTRQRMLESQQLIEQLAEKTKMMLDDGKQTMRIQLKPEMLGEARLEVSVEDNRLTANFQVEQGRTRELLDSQVRQLQRSLEQMGLEVDQINIQEMSTETGPGDTDAWFDEAPDQNAPGTQPPAEPEPEEQPLPTGPHRRPTYSYSTLELVA